MATSTLIYGTRNTNTLTLFSEERKPDLFILDGKDENSFPILDQTQIKEMSKGQVVAYIVTLNTLEIAKEALESLGLKQCRMVSTDGDANSDTPLLGDKARTMVVLAVKQGSPTFNDRYHLGVLNDQPQNPTPTKPEQGGVLRNTVHLKTPSEMLTYTLGELVALHTRPGQNVAISDTLINKGTTLSFLHRTKPPKPDPSPQAKANKAKREAAKIAATLSGVKL